MNRILLDSGFLAAAFDRSDIHHQQASQFLSEHGQRCLIPEVSLSEVAFLLRRSGGVPAVALFTRALIGLQPVFQTLDSADLFRAGEIMDIYRTAQLDFVDCCMMALSERLNITQVATFDRRDFSIFRLKNGNYLELWP